MVKVINPLHSGSASGKFGGVVFGSNRGVNYARSLPNIKAPNPGWVAIRMRAVWEKIQHDTGGFGLICFGSLKAIGLKNEMYVIRFENLSQLTALVSLGWIGSSSQVRTQDDFYNWVELSLTNKDVRKGQNSLYVAFYKKYSDVIFLPELMVDAELFGPNIPINNEVNDWGYMVPNHFLRLRADPPDPVGVGIGSFGNKYNRLFQITDGSKQAKVFLAADLIVDGTLTQIGEFGF